MGEVYRARDAKLGRDVAIKVLPDALSNDHDRIGRFEREAKALAALNHPNIAAIYGFEGRAIVMELVDGPTLEQRLAAGRIPLEDALEIAAQIADALEAAHEKGIIHRDLKPANVKAPLDGPVKVLDLGLATAFPGADSAESDPLNSPTRTSSPTEAGIILGTAAYMSPEQASGKRVDKRADLWAFGAVLWEMLTGGRLFGPSESVSHTIADVLRSPIDFGKLPASTPAPIVQLLRRCLDRNPKTRLRDIGEARIAIAAYQANPRGETLRGNGPHATGARAAWIVAAMAVLVAGTLAFVHFREASQQPLVLRTQIQTPELPANRQFAIAPDGRHLAVAGVIGGKRQLWLRSMDSTEGQLLPGTETASFPFWSPDSRYIGFFAQGKVKKMVASGGPPETVCDAANGRGGSWSKDQQILFSSDDGGGFSLRQVPATGGTPTIVIRPVKGLVRFPVFLPDGQHFLYLLTRASVEENGIYYTSLDGRGTRRLLPDESTVTLTRTHLLFVRDKTLLEMSFVPETGQTTGDPFPVASGVTLTSNVVYAPVTASDTGVLVFETGGAVSGDNHLTWYDSSGKSLETIGVSGPVFEPAISPDLKSVAFMRLSATGADVWVWDRARGAEQRFTTDPAFAVAPLWSPRGDHILFQSNRLLGIRNLYQQPLTGTEPEALLLQTPNRKTATQWTRDGRFIVYTEWTDKTKADIWVSPIENGKAGKPTLFLGSGFNEDYGQLSPDGRWMAYMSDESGRDEIYVRAFPGGAGQKRISNAGGDEPRWRGDGRELYFLGLDGQLTAVPTNAGTAATAGFEPGPPRALFPVPRVAVYTSSRYDVAPDGQRFLIAVAAPVSAASPLNVVMNWESALRR
jgi:Tol biopolymer transport system component